LNNIVFNTIFGSCPVDISDEDILDAMKSIPGYLDITPGDFKEIFRHAYRHAIERIAQSLVAKDVMTAKLISVTPNTGVISEKDFLFHMGEKKTRSTMEVIAQCLSSKGCVAVSMNTGFAKDIMTSPALTVFDDTPVFEIASIFAEKNINRVPVLDKNGYLVGIVARADIFRTTCAL